MEDNAWDDFKSRIMHVPMMDNGMIPVDVMVHDSFAADDEVYFQPQEYGWEDPGLKNILLARAKLGLPDALRLFFRGHALFDNIDDAKNDYLMNPEIEVSTADSGPGVDNEHIPFGIVIPSWGPGQSLTAVTIILFWQELS